MAVEAIITRAKILDVAQGLPAAPRVFAELERILTDPEASLEHVADAGLIADPAAELADAFLTGIGLCWHRP